MATDEDVAEIVNDASAPPEQTEAQKRIVKQAKTDLTYGSDWESVARSRFDYDYKFANGDSHNKYQWDEDILADRDGRPCLTVNKAQQHNLMIINDAKQNKPGVRIRPVGDEATYEAAQIFQEIVYHIEYISGAENVYDNAVTWAVEAGIGYWQTVIEPISIDSFDQEIKIKRIKDPRSVYLDPDINEVDGSDARWGLIFEDVPKSVFAETYPQYVSVVGTGTLSATFSGQDKWITQNHIRLCLYYRKDQQKDKLISFVTDDGMQIQKRVSLLNDMEKMLYKEVSRNKATREHYQYRERKVLTDKIKWYKVAGDWVVEEGDWLGKYIPIIRLPGTETVIDGVLDRKGHTRALINAQQMYNYNTSADAEFGALQTKVPWLTPSAAIGENIQYWETANTKNHAYLPYEHIDENGDPIPSPSRPQPPMPSPAYAEGRKTAQNEMMMASGQYQAQFGEAENAKSGVAINARQRQGDRATYHFIDNQAIAIRFQGKILIDLIPKVYDVKRVMRITASDGEIMDVTIDPDAQQPMQKVDNPNGPVKDKNKTVQEIIFNPNIGMYDVQSDTGPSYATKRMEAAAALTQLAAGDKTFMERYADFLFKTLDFPEAANMAERAQKFLPPNVLGEQDPTNDPRVQQLMHQASDHIEKLTGELGATKQQLADKQRDLERKEHELELAFRKEGAEQARGDYDAETKRITALGNAGPGMSMEQIQPVIKQLIADMLREGSPAPGPGPHEGGTPIQLPPEPAEGEGATSAAGAANGVTGEAENEPDVPSMPGSQLAPDGRHYIEHSPGQWARVEAGA
jgi:hypothetical protein